MKNKSLSIPILNSEYKVIVCWGNEKEIKKVINSWHDGKADLMGSMENRRGVCFYKHDCHPIIALPRFPKTPDEIATLAHEAVHAVNDIFNKLEENYKADHEVFAHSVGAIVRETLKVASKK